MKRMASGVGGVSGGDSMASSMQKGTTGVISVSDRSWGHTVTREDITFWHVGPGIFPWVFRMIINKLNQDSVILYLESNNR